MRLLLALTGLALLAYGAVLAWDFATSRTVNAVQGAAWFIGGPLVHDGLVAPVAGLAGLGIGRVLPRPWRAPVVAGLVSTGVLALLGLPLLWRPFGAATNPGLHDRDYGTGLAVALGIVWVVVVVTGWARQHRSRPAPERTQPLVLPDGEADAVFGHARPAGQPISISITAALPSTRSSAAANSSGVRTRSPRAPNERAYAAKSGFTRPVPYSRLGNRRRWWSRIVP